MNISKPHDLHVGDKISFKDQGLAGIDGEEFLVDAVSTYLFYGDFEYAEFTLSDNYGAKYFLSIESEKGEEYLTLSKELRPDEIYTIFDQENFDAAVQKKGSSKVKTKIKEIPATLQGWLAGAYKKDQSFEKARYADKDFRTEMIENWEDLEYHLFLDRSEEMAIEVEVYESGDIEVSLTVYPDFEDIKSMSR